MLVSSASRATAFPAFSTAATTSSVIRSTGLPRFVIRQRRHSSSNKHSSTAKQQQQAPVASAPKQDQHGAQQGQQQQTQPQPNKRGARRHDSGKVGKELKSQSNTNNATAQEPKTKQPKSAEAIAADVQAQLDSITMPPSVPSTSHIDPKVVHLARVFAQHRPISLNQPIPTSDSKTAFDSIFAAPSPRKKTQDVMFTLANTVKLLESAAGTPSSSAPTINLEELAKNFRPFNVPPAPVPMDPKYLQKPQNHTLAEAANKRQQGKAKKSAQSEAALTSATSSSPMPSGAVAEIGAEEVSSTTNNAILAPFRERMRARHEPWLGSWLRRMREQWQLISVKRQRKLKMKKHKYKKLMRRTRNLRRRQDRL